MQARSKLLNYLTEWQTLETNDWRKLREEISGKQDLEREQLSIKMNFLGKKVDTLVQITGEYLNRPNGPYPPPEQVAQEFRMRIQAKETLYYEELNRVNKELTAKWIEEMQRLQQTSSETNTVDSLIPPPAHTALTKMGE